MRLHRFYISKAISEDTFDIGDRELVNQWRSVFRYNVGSQVIVFNGDGFDYLAMITSLRNLGATLEIVKKTKNKNLPKMNVSLCVGIIKKDNFELVVQKATELGVTQIIPILCERSEKKNINMQRLQKIAIEASEQSGRGDVPVIHEITELSLLLDSDILPQNKIVLHLEGEYIGDYLARNESKGIAIFIGTEGGWSEREIKEFALHNIMSVCLSSQVLRAETASIAVSSLLLL
ncbi:MAG: 16S rRNA (uracil(1498)-N(3))-methyltransferase [Candidatus Zambryskibacteria bacterium]|nr:16S rRNA (uracil(1498)-N(3))-methyltransferase [Candidatus Zambryskibacteria bacterium]